MTLTFCVTAYNEFENLPSLVRLFEGLREFSPLPCKMLIIDNGSSDGSFEFLQKISIEGLSVERISPNRMYGGGMKCAVSRADTEIVCTIPADNQYSLHDILNVIDSYIKGASPTLMAKGKRTHREDPLYVRFLSSGFNVMCRLLLGVQKLDVNAMPKIFNKRIIESCLDLLPNDQLFDAGLVVEWQKQGASFIEVPVTFHNRTSGSPSWGAGKTKLARRMFDSLIALRRKQLQ